MQIQAADKTQFCARNKTIRFADDICRQANIAFPRISSTKMAVKENSDKFEKTIERLNSSISGELRENTKELYLEADTFMAELLAMLKPIKKHKLGNCGESAHIGAIAAKINGIKDCCPVFLYKNDGEDLYHMAVYVYDGKKSYIIDPWLGFADYVDNTLTKYKNEFASVLEIEPEDNINFICKINDGYTKTLKNELSKKQRNKLGKIFPKMKINKYYTNN